jgi:hypothetical protein
MRGPCPNTSSPADLTMFLHSGLIPWARILGTLHLQDHRHTCHMWMTFLPASLATATAGQVSVLVLVRLSTATAPRRHGPAPSGLAGWVSLLSLVIGSTPGLDWTSGLDQLLPAADPVRFRSWPGKVAGSRYTALDTGCLPCSQ